MLKNRMEIGYSPKGSVTMCKLNRKDVLYVCLLYFVTSPLPCQSHVAKRKMERARWEEGKRLVNK